jgi:hypothetical protein
VTEVIGGCWVGALPDNEGEPPLVDEYVDTHNGGCNTPPDHPFQTIVGEADGSAFLSGRSGWYQVGGQPHRGTDWFILTMGAAGSIEITACAPEPTYLFELGPQDCGAVGVLASVLVPMNVAKTMTITGYAPGEPVWFWVGPTVFSPPGGQHTYAYHLWFDGLAQPVATERVSWTAVKGLFK